MNCRIELLSPSLIAAEPQLVSHIDRMRKLLGIDLGWHYLLDLVWILRAVKDLRLSSILDAGAGRGLLQFILAEAGHSVISVDFAPRKFSLSAKLAYNLRILHRESVSDRYLEHLQSRDRGAGQAAFRLQLLTKLGLHKLATTATAMFALPHLLQERRRHGRGRADLQVYQTRIEAMPQLPDSSVDAIVSVSALEHMEPPAVRLAAAEFRRVLKPGGKMAITTSASEGSDWYHEPSQGWCFSEPTLKGMLDLDPDCRSNWRDYGSILSQVMGSDELRKRLSLRYRLSGANGMPWGVWDPKYLPVGVAVDLDS